VVNESFPSFPSLHASTYTASQGVFNPATGVWNIASLGKGVTDTLTITVTAPAACGGLTCSATASSDVTDPATGNNTGTSTTAISDNTAPTITCPPNQTAVTANPGASTVVVNYPAPTAGDNCGTPTVVCTPPSGSTFSRGTTTVNCTATDSASHTATCSFTVTVFDACLQDDANASSVLLFNTATGDWRFCCGGTVYTGKGTVRAIGQQFTISDSLGSIRLTGNVNGATHSGNANIQSPPGSVRCTITDRDTRNNSCNCAITPAP
jgi:hypothetical protein